MVALQPKVGRPHGNGQDAAADLEHGRFWDLIGIFSSFRTGRAPCVRGSRRPLALTSG